MRSPLRFFRAREDKRDALLAQKKVHREIRPARNLRERVREEGVMKMDLVCCLLHCSANDVQMLSILLLQCCHVFEPNVWHWMKDVQEWKSSMISSHSLILAFYSDLRQWCMHSDP